HPHGEVRIVDRLEEQAGRRADVARVAQPPAIGEGRRRVVDAMRAHARGDRILLAVKQDELAGRTLARRSADEIVEMVELALPPVDADRHRWSRRTSRSRGVAASRGREHEDRDEKNAHHAPSYLESHSLIAQGVNTYAAGMRSEALKGHLGLLVLSVLHNAPAHGY